jgi:uncharacterized protein YkwD
MAALVLVQPDGTEKRLPLDRAPVVVGRADDCDLRIEEQRASRRHFQVEPSDRGWVLRDLESSNGTAVNGFAVSLALLNAGDTIEVGGCDIRFEGEGPATPRVPRPPRRAPSSGPAWAGVVVAVAAVAFLADMLVASTAAARAKERDDAVRRSVQAEFAVAAAEPDPDACEAALAAACAKHPDAAEAPAALRRLAEVRAGRESRVGAAADLEAYRAVAGSLAPEEARWRLDALLRRWQDDPAAVEEIRRRLSTGGAVPAPAEDGRVQFQRRKADADAAVAEGRPGRALSLWLAHAAEGAAGGRSAAADLRAEVARAEDAAAAVATAALRKAEALAAGGDAAGARRALEEALEAVGDAAAGRRLAARLAGGSPAAGTEGGRAAGGARTGTGGGAAGDEAGYARRRTLYLEAREAEQFVALRDYGEAARRYEGLGREARDLADVRAEFEARAVELKGVATLLAALRAAPPAGRALPATLEAIPVADLWKLLEPRAKAGAERLALAAFGYDHGLAADARKVVAKCLDDASVRDAAQRLYAAREGVPVPEGGFVADKDEVVTRAEWNRRRNAEAIARARDRQESLLARVRDTNLVRGIRRIATLRADLDKRRGHALELIFDEIRYFYPYRDRMKEYTPVQAEVDERVKAVRALWDDETKVRTKPEGPTLVLLKDLDAVAAQLKELGAAPGAAEAELEILRRYFDRELTVRSWFTDPAEAALMEKDRAVLADNAARKSVAEVTERRQVEITNEYRLMMGRRALRLDDLLVKSSRAHGEDMSRGGFFSHFNELLLHPRPGQSIPRQACGCGSDSVVAGCSHGPDGRMRQAGYSFVACSENIHAGSGDPESAHKGWARSSGHHRNLLATAWTDMGTGRSGNFWVQNFGTPPEPEQPGEGGAGSNPWDGAGGRGTGGDGNDPR